MTPATLMKYERKCSNVSRFKVGDRIKGKHKTSNDIAEFTVIGVNAEAVESDSFYFWIDDWVFEVQDRPWVLPTEAGIYINEDDIEHLGSSIRVWQLSVGYWAEFDSFKTPEEVVEDLTYRKIHLIRLHAT